MGIEDEDNSKALPIFCWILLGSFREKKKYPPLTNPTRAKITDRTMQHPRFPLLPYSVSLVSEGVRDSAHSMPAGAMLGMAPYEGEAAILYFVRDITYLTHLDDEEKR
jgi:hypothetical protein